jgi:glutathione peroxidase-family protein
LNSGTRQTPSIGFRIGQEPGSNASIKDFCETRFGVDFPLFPKVGVTAANANPLSLARGAGEGGQRGVAAIRRIDSVREVA